MSKAVLGLGTNLGDKIHNLSEAVSAISLLPKTRIISKSRVYRTEPVGYRDQYDFLNCCILVETSLSPNALLGACLGIEAAMGRIRLFKNGPRVVDIDLLLYEGFSAASDELTIPHPRMFERAFVICPLIDLFPSGTAFGFTLDPAACLYGGVDATDYEL